MKLQLSLVQEKQEQKEKKLRPVPTGRQLTLTDNALKKVAGMQVREIMAKSVLTKGKPPLQDYSLNPYQGCGFACTYCYAQRYREYFGATLEWGKFVFAKVNAATILSHEIREAGPGSVFVSSATDCYQWVESQYRLTRSCLEVLLKREKDFQVRVLTKSPLVVRDAALLKKFSDASVGFSIATNDETVKNWFEKASPSINSRLWALEKMKRMGFKTFASIAPLLPMNPKEFAEKLEGKVDWAWIGEMNYEQFTREICAKIGLDYKKYFNEARKELEYWLQRKGIGC